MNHCPVCNEQIVCSICSSCGFDISCHYEFHPTLVAIPNGISAVSNRINTPLVSRLACPACNRTAFGIEILSGHHVCLNCNLELDTAQFEELLQTAQTSQFFDKLAKKTDLEPVHQRVAFSKRATVLLNREGTVSFTGNTPLLYTYSRGWKKIISIAFTKGSYPESLVALTSDRTVKALDAGSTRISHQLSIWSDIIDIAVGTTWVLGLKSDGSVVTAGTRCVGMNCIPSWTNIAAVSAGYSHAVGLRRDGTVVAAGANDLGRCNTEQWQNVTAIAAGDMHTVALLRDGTVLAIGDNQCGQCNTQEWTKIIAIAAGKKHTLGLRYDGTVVATGHNDNGQCNVHSWKQIEHIQAGPYTSIGICADGQLELTGMTY